MVSTVLGSVAAVALVALGLEDVDTAFLVAVVLVVLVVVAAGFSAGFAVGLNCTPKLGRLK